MNLVYEKRKTQRITLFGSSPLPAGYYIDKRGRELLAETVEEGEVPPVIGIVNGSQIVVHVSNFESDAEQQRAFVRRARESGLCVMPVEDTDGFGRRYKEYVVLE